METSWKMSRRYLGKISEGNGMYKSSPASLMTKGIVLGLQLGRNGLPVDMGKVALFDDGEKEILVSPVIPLGRHGG